MNGGGGDGTGSASKGEGGGPRAAFLWLCGPPHGGNERKRQYAGPLTGTAHKFDEPIIYEISRKGTKEMAPTVVEATPFTNGQSSESSGIDGTNGKRESYGNNALQPIAARFHPL